MYRTDIAIDDIVIITGRGRREFAAQYPMSFWRVEWTNGEYIIAGKLNSTVWTGFRMSDISPVSKENVPAELLANEVLSPPHFKSDSLNQAAGLLKG